MSRSVILGLRCTGPSQAMGRQGNWGVADVCFEGYSLLQFLTEWGGNGSGSESHSCPQERTAVLWCQHRMCRFPLWGHPNQVVYFLSRGRLSPRLPFPCSVLVSPGCHNRVPHTGQLKQQKFTSHVPGGWKAEIEVPAGLLSSTPSPWLVDGCRLPWPHTVFLCMFPCPNVLFL